MEVEMKIETATLQSFSERRKIREELQRSESQGIRVDVADVCKCPNCGIDHYRPRSEAEANEKVK